MKILTHRMVDVGDIQLHVVEAGSGPTVLLLHGLPGYWYSWRNQIESLVAAGYRVVVPDLRGVNSSGRSKAVSSYRIQYLARDVVSLMDTLKCTPVVLVGQGWGGLVAWRIANDYSSLVKKLVILNMPHPQKLRLGLRDRRYLRGRLAWLMLQLPWVPDTLLDWSRELWVKRSFATGLSMTRDLSRNEVWEFQRTMSSPGAVSAVLNHLRALRYEWNVDWESELRRIDCETLLIWGERERSFSDGMKAPGRMWVPKVEEMTISGAGRFPQMERPIALNEALLGFMKRSPDSGGSTEVSRASLAAG